MSFNLWEFLLGPKRPRSYVDSNAAWPRTKETYEKTSDFFNVSVKTDGTIVIFIGSPDHWSTRLRLTADALGVEEMIQELQKAVVASKQMTREVPSECMFDPEMYKDQECPASKPTKPIVP